MEAGRSFAEGVKTAQEFGVAETDPSHDVDGWDSIMKVCAIARVILRTPLLPTMCDAKEYADSIRRRCKQREPKVNLTSCSRALR